MYVFYHLAKLSGPPVMLTQATYESINKMWAPVIFFKCLNNCTECGFRYYVNTTYESHFSLSDKILFLPFRGFLFIHFSVAVKISFSAFIELTHH